MNCPNCGRHVRYGSEHARDNGDPHSCTWVCNLYRPGGRDPARIGRVLALLKEYWELAPDLRLGQIIMNFTPIPECNCGNGHPYHNDDCAIFRRDPYNWEESHWEAALEKAIAEMKG